jgi:hypothetical protein
LFGGQFENFFGPIVPYSYIDNKGFTSWTVMQITGSPHPSQKNQPLSRITNYSKNCCSTISFSSPKSSRSFDNYADTAVPELTISRLSNFWFPVALQIISLIHTLIFDTSCSMAEYCTPAVLRSSICGHFTW